MSPEREQMRRTLAWVAGITGWILLICAVVVAVLMKRAASSDARTFAAQLAALDAKASAERSAHEETRRRFEVVTTLADAQFPNDPPERRLTLLRERIEAITRPEIALQGRRYIGAEGIERIRAKLQNAPALDVEIAGEWGDAEARALADEMRTLFEGAGFKVRKLAEYPQGVTRRKGVAVYSKSQFDEVLGDAVGQLFTEISQEPIRWIARDLAGTPKPGEEEPDIKIIIGPR